MADNVILEGTLTSSGVIVAGDVLTYSGDSSLIQLQRPVHVIGAEGSHTLVEIVYAEDAATPSTIYGQAGMMERDDVLSSLTPVAGDWVGMRSTAEGALWTQDFNSDAILSDTTDIKTAVETIDNAVSGAGFNITQLGGVNVSLNTGARDTGTQRVTIATDDVVPVTIAQDVMLGTDFSSVFGTADLIVNLTSDNVAATLIASAVSSFSHVFDGVTWDRTRGDATNGLLVNLGNNNDVGLNAGTNAIGKLAANTGVDIGDVDVTSIIPGTGATNLGKAEDAAHTSGDVGVAMLGVYSTLDDVGIAVGTDGDYAMPRIDVRGRLRVSPGALHILDNFNSDTGWAAVDGDTTNLATTTNHLLAANALTFDKANTGANSVFAMIERTITSVDVFNLVTGAIFLQVFALIPDVTNIVNVVIRLGSNSSNYNTWKIDATQATTDHFESFRTLLANTVGSTGTGVNLTAVTYMAVGFEFLLETNTLAGLVVDAAVLTSGQVHSTDSSSDIVTQISSSNINLHKVGNKVTATQAGNDATGTQRVILASDQNFVHIDDAGFTLGTHAGVMMMGFAGTQSVDANDAAALACQTDGALNVFNDGLTELAAAINSSKLDIDIASSTVDVMLGTDFSAVFGAASLITAGTLADGVATTQDVLNVRNFNYIYNGTSFDFMREGGEAGSVLVDMGANNDVAATLNAETSKVIGTVRAASGGFAAGAIAAGATSFVKLDDVAFSANDAGVPMMAIRDDVQGAITPADQDYTPVKADMFGNLKTTNLPDATSVIKYAVVNAASGDNEIVALVSATKIRVLSVLLIARGTTNARFESNAAGTALTGEMPLIVNSGFTLPFNPGGWFESASGQSISLECTADIDGMISYVEV